MKTFTYQNHLHMVKLPLITLAQHCTADKNQLVLDFCVTCTSTKDTQVIATDCIYKLLGSSNIAQCILYTINILASGS